MRIIASWFGSPMAHRIQVCERDRLRQLASSPRHRLRAYHDLRQATHRRADGLRVPWVETRTWSSFKQATRSNDLNQRLDRNHPIQVLGGEIEVAGAERLDPPRDLVHAGPPARGPPAPAVDDPLCPVRLISVAQPAKVPLAHPQQRSSLHAAQLPRLMQPNRIDDPGHSDLRQHAIPPAQTGQIVCYQTRTYRVSPTSTVITTCRRCSAVSRSPMGSRTSAEKLNPLPPDPARHQHSAIAPCGSALKLSPQSPW